MGGDDLGDDLTYLRKTVSDSTPSPSPTTTTKTTQGAALERSDPTIRKRRRMDLEDDGDGDNDKDNDDDDKDRTADDYESVEGLDDETEPRSKKRKSSAKLLIEMGRNLETEPPNVQSAFLRTSLSHYTQMKGLSVDDAFIDVEPSMLLRCHPSSSEKETPASTSASTSSSSSSYEARFRSAVSMKKLKGWKPLGSPMVLIVCVSARRATDVLKELAGLRVRAAKLFAKHMNLDDQREMLSGRPFGIAVGTPRRLLDLCSPGPRGGDGESATGTNKSPLYFGKTRLVILDSHSNQKGFTVCTLPDTAPSCMDLLRDYILPQLHQRKDMRLAIF